MSNRNNVPVMVNDGFKMENSTSEINVSFWEGGGVIETSIDNRRQEVAWVEDELAGKATCNE